MNEEIARRTHDRITRLAERGPQAIDRRLRELENEWDIERVLEMNFASVVLLFSYLGRKVHRSFFALPAIAGFFMVQHVLSGWCPPVPFLRRMGVRTESEIDAERHALRALRLDFDLMSADQVDSAIDDALESVEFSTENL